MATKKAPAKKTTAKKAAPKKKKVAAKKVAPKKVAAKKAPAKRAAAKKPAPQKPSKEVKEEVVTLKERPSKTVDRAMKKQEKPASQAGLLPTTYTEISRIHRSALSTLKGSMVITSSQDGEGSSLLAHLMAQRSSENGQKTLLIDLNLRNQALTIDFDAPTIPWGLDTWLPNAPLDNLIKSVDGVDNLYFMAAPSDHNSVVFLKDVHRAAQFLDTLEKGFDHIVIDTTPIGALNRYNADPIILSAAAQRTVMIMQAGVTSRDKVLRAIKQLREAGANIEGMVVNDRDNPPIRQQLLSFASKFKFLPGLHKWMRNKIMDCHDFD